MVFSFIASWALNLHSVHNTNIVIFMFHHLLVYSDGAGLLKFEFGGTFSRRFSDFQLEIITEPVSSVCAPK